MSSDVVVCICDNLSNDTPRVLLRFPAIQSCIMRIIQACRYRSVYRTVVAAVPWPGAPELTPDSSANAARPKLSGRSTKASPGPWQRWPVLLLNATSVWDTVGWSLFGTGAASGCVRQPIATRSGQNRQSSHPLGPNCRDCMALALHVFFFLFAFLRGPHRAVPA
jgi:hypothetical protein